MNFVTSVFKKYINKNDDKQIHPEKAIRDGTAKCTNNIAEAHKGDEIKIPPTSQRPTQKHPRIFEEDEPFEDAQTNPETASMEKQIKGPLTNFQRSSSIQPDSLNTSMTDSLEITIPETSAISALQASIEKSQEFLKPDDFEEYQSLSPMIVADSQRTPVSLSDILKPKSVKSSQSCLEVLIRQVNKSLAIDETIESKEHEVFCAEHEESKDIISEKGETSEPQYMDDLVIKLATCFLQDKTNAASQELNQKTVTIEDRLDILSNHNVPSLSYITSALIKDSKNQINATEKQASLEAPIPLKGDFRDTKKVIFEQTHKEEYSTGKNYNEPETANFKMTKSDKSNKEYENNGQYTTVSKKLVKERLESAKESLMMSVELSCYKTENNEETASIKFSSIETDKSSDKSKHPVSEQNDLVEVNRNSIVEFETLEKQCTDKILNEQYIVLTKQSWEENQDKVLPKTLLDEYQEVQKYTTEQKNYDQAGVASVNGDSIENELQEPKSNIYTRQETLEFETLERQLAGKSKVQKDDNISEGIVVENLFVMNFNPEEQTDNVYGNQSQETNFAGEEQELDKSIKLQINNILNDIIEESQQKVIEKLACNEDAERIEAKQLQSDSTNILYTTHKTPNFVEYSDAVEQFVVDNISSQNSEEVQIDQHEIYSRQEKLEYEKLEKRLNEKSFKPSHKDNILEGISSENIGESQTSEAVDAINKFLSRENLKGVEEESFQGESIKPLNLNNYSSNRSCSKEEKFESKKLEPNNCNSPKINDILEELMAESVRNNIESSQNNDLNFKEKVQIDQHGVYKRQETLEFEKLEKKFEDSSLNQKVDNILEEIVAESSFSLPQSNHKVAEYGFKQENLETVNQETVPEGSVKRANKGEYSSMSCSNTKNNINQIDTLIDSITDAKIDPCINSISNFGITPPKPKQGSPQKIINKVEVRPNIRNKSKSTVSIKLVKPKENNVEDEELSSKVDILEDELDSIKKIESNRKPEPQTENNKDVINKYRKLLEEYENHIAEQTRDLEQLKIESEINIRHFTNTEMAFSDVFEKYEKAKGVIAVYKRNEETLSENLKNAGEQIFELEAKCSKMKQQSLEYIKRVSEQIEQEKRRYNQDIGKLHAQVKRLEIKASSLEVSLKQKADECQALAALCDDITGRS